MVLGFSWNPDEDKWNEQYKQLVQYKEKHDGNCNVPSEYKDNPQLATWVTTQRTNYKKGKLSPEQIKLLEEIDFSWNTYKDRWDEKFKELVQYKQVNGNCNVSSKGKINAQLGNWVSNQRAAYKKGKLSSKQIESMNGIGFKWVSDRGYKPSRERLDAAETKNSASGGEEVGKDTSSAGEILPSSPPLPVVTSPEKKDVQEVDKLRPTKDNTKILRLIGTINERLSEKYSLISAAAYRKDDSAVAKYQAQVYELEDTKE